MRTGMIALRAGLMMASLITVSLLPIAGPALAQEEGAAARPAAPAPAAAAGVPAAGNRTSNANANAIKPGSMVAPHGQNGFGGGAAVPGLFRENPGNGLYGASSGGF